MTAVVSLRSGGSRFGAVLMMLNARVSCLGSGTTIYRVGPKSHAVFSFQLVAMSNLVKNLQFCWIRRLVSFVCLIWRYFPLSFVSIDDMLASQFLSGVKVPLKTNDLP
jgi:hypothetical protein